MQVFPTVEGVDVFVNEADGITIRQESAVGEEASIIAIPVRYIGALCKALRLAAKEAQDSTDA